MRAVVGLPLGDPSMKTPAAIMYNILGEEEVLLALSISPFCILYHIYEIRSFFSPIPVEVMLLYLSGFHYYKNNNNCYYYYQVHGCKRVVILLMNNFFHIIIHEMKM